MYYPDDWLLIVMILAAAILIVPLWFQREPELELCPVRIGPVVELIHATGTITHDSTYAISASCEAPVTDVLVREGDIVGGDSPVIMLEDHGDCGHAIAAGAAHDDPCHVLRAPMAGVVLERIAEPGDIPLPGKPLLLIGPTSQLRIAAVIDAGDAARISVGQSALLSGGTAPGQVLRGHVTQFSPAARSGGNGRALIALDDHDAPLPLDTIVQVSIVTRRVDRAMLVPHGAIRDGRVWVAQGSRVKSRPVTTGIIGSHDIQILSGLEADEMVVCAPPEGLQDGARVRCREHLSDA